MVSRMIHTRFFEPSRRPAHRLPCTRKVVVPRTHSLGLWCRIVATHLLLFACLVQGIAPDQSSLASLSALRVFSPIQSFCQPDGNIGTTSPEEIVTTKPQDESGTSLVARLTSDSASLIDRMFERRALQIPSLWGSASVPDRLCVVLCRLLC